jgi:hypothetical protein
LLFPVSKHFLEVVKQGGISATFLLPIIKQLYITGKTQAMGITNLYAGSIGMV